MNRLFKLSQKYSGNLQEFKSLFKTESSFILTCHNLIIEAYYSLKAKGYDVNWDEETFSANMKDLLEKVCFKRSLPYHIIRENVQDTEAILKGIVKARTARKIDIVFATFIVSKKLVYGIEAKMLVENDFNGRRFSRLNAEYIDEGIDRYTKNIYKIHGCMIGYVIEGNPDSIISKINTLLIKRRRSKEIIENKHTINNFHHCYISRHSDLIITHFLLPFLIIEQK